ncbi:MAG: DUF6491 family protein [Micropepsaceae bacterium]
MIKRVLTVSAVVLTLGGVAWAEDTKPSSCAFVRSIDSWKEIDETHAYIYTSPRRKFKVTFFAPCRELKWAIFARLETRPSSAVCLSVGDTLVFGRGGVLPSRRWEFEERCTITEIEAAPMDEPKSEKPAPATP